MSKFLEIDIENYLWELVQSGQFFTNKLMLERAIYFRQYKIDGVGIVDLISVRIERCFYQNKRVENILKVRVFELKRGEVNCDSVGQVCRYIDMIKADTSIILKNAGLDSRYRVDVDGVLIGRGITKDAAHIVSLMSQTLEVWTFDFSLEKGITFNQFEMIDFCSSHHNRDIKKISYSAPRLKTYRHHRAIESFDYRHESHPMPHGSNPF